MKSKILLLSIVSVFSVGNFALDNSYSKTPLTNTTSSVNDEIVYKVKSVFNFNEIKHLKHGTKYKSPFENNVYLVYPYNQKAGTRNGESFSYGGTTASFEFFPVTRTTFNPNKKYEVSFRIGSSTYQQKNKHKVKFTVTTLLDQPIYENKNLFGRSYGVKKIIVSGKLLKNGLKIKNSMVKVDDIIVKELSY